MGKIRTAAALAAALFVGSLTGTIVSAQNSALAAAEPAGEVAAEALNVPSGAVVAFNRTSCPSGWSQFVKARGRAIVGLNPGGTLRGTVGTKLGDKEVRKHDHAVDPVSLPTSSAGDHSHAWLNYQNGAFTAGSGQEMIAWGDGIDSAGAGVYPVAVDFKGSPNLITHYNTGQSGNHGHLVDIPETTSAATWHRFPYVQLLMCVKN